MEYDIILTADAERELETLLPFLQRAVESRLIEIASSPSQVSRLADSTTPSSVGMISEFVTPPYGKAQHSFAILFRYSQDETKLIVLGLGHIELSTGESG